MEGALIILVVTVVVGVILYLADRMRHKHNKDGSAEAELPRQEEVERAETEPLSATAGTHGPLCCGQHLVCEKYPPTDKIIYYDDEELDRFAGRSGDDYTDEEIEEFQEVLMTLRPEDALGWSRSVEQRHITLPADVRDGLMMLIAEA